MADSSERSKSARFLVHDSNGFHVWSTSQSNVEAVKTYQTDPNQKPMNLIASDDGRFLAIIYKSIVKIFSNQNLDVPVYELAYEDVRQVSFSPKSNFLLLFCSPTAPKNLKLISLLKDAELINEWTDKKRELIQWSSDETIGHRLSGSEVMFYENNDFTKCAHKISQVKVTAYGFVTNKAGCSFVSIFIKGQKGQPSMVKVHSYPHLENAIVSKSFYKVDNVEIKWNLKGDAMLVLASTDYDSSGKSYYGETMLHFLDLRGETQTITGRKEGTVASAEWLPNNDGFIVIQGKMPASITWYNNRAEVIFNFGDGPVNSIELNPFGNLVAFTGFGNLSGHLYIWNLRTKTLISSFRAVDTTCFVWLADGQHLVTGTHYDRLKMANGFKVWNYLGTMLHQEDCKDDSPLQLYKLLSIDQKDSFQETQINTNIKGKMLTDEPVKKYVPPSLRKSGTSLSKPPPPLPPRQVPKAKESKKAAAGGAQKDPQVVKEKKLKNLNKKLQQIEQLKKQQEEGKKLEKNQLDKIEKEQEILKEIETLKLEA